MLEKDEKTAWIRNNFIAYGAEIFSVINNPWKSDPVL